MTMIEIGLIGIALAVIGGFAYHDRKIKEKLSVQESSIEKILAELTALCCTTQGFGSRLIDVETSIRKLISQRQAVQYPGNTPTTLFSQAKKLLALGASLEDIEQSCGLSKSEAKLIAMTFDVPQNDKVEQK